MSAPVAILDASALLAWLFQERGHEAISKLAGKCAIASANMTEVLYRAAQEGYEDDLGDLYANLVSGGFAVVDNPPEDAIVAAQLIATSRSKGGHLSLGDGLGIAAAARLGLPIVGGDQEWEPLELPTKVIPFR